MLESNEFTTVTKKTSIGKHLQEVLQSRNEANRSPTLLDLKSPKDLVNIQTTETGGEITPI
jgi:hypothetical protein